MGMHQRKKKYLGTKRGQETSDGRRPPKVEANIWDRVGNKKRMQTLWILETYRDQCRMNDETLQL